MSGCWSRDNLLALGSEDKTLTISTDNGETIRQVLLRDTPSQIVFSERKQDSRSKLIEGTVSLHFFIQIRINVIVSELKQVSLILKQKTLYFYTIEDPDNPIELAFQTKYGDVVKYEW